MENFFEVEEIVEQLNICEGDTLLIGSDMTALAIYFLKHKRKLDLNVFLDAIIKKLGNEGTLLLPTFNWDFCEGVPFEYDKTVSKTGSLTNKALKRIDFKRTQHPIYSFAVWGKDQELLFNLQNKSSFGADSPFAYLHEKKAKMLIIGLGYQTSFTFVHYVEEMEQVQYRYMKEFTALYTDYRGVKSEKTYAMNVRDIDKGVLTRIEPMGEHLEVKGVASRKHLAGTNFIMVDLAGAYELIKQEIYDNNAEKLFEIAKG